MKKKERLEYITKQVQINKTISVLELAKNLNVTEKTIRLDLEILEKANILYRTHGGAILNISSHNMFPSKEYRLRSNKEKKEIALEALKMIKPNDTIILDDGTTTLELAKLLGDFPVTVITNDIEIINTLLTKSNVELFIIGGILKRNEYSYIISGDDAINFIKKFHINKLFLGVSSIDKKKGLMLFHYGDKSIKKTFISMSETKICLADSDKFNKPSFVSYADLKEIDYIITDSKINKKTILDFENLGPKIIYSSK